MKIYQPGITGLTGWRQKIKTGITRSTFVLAASLVLVSALATERLQQVEQEHSRERRDLQDKIYDLKRSGTKRDREMQDLEKRYRELERYTRELETLLSCLRRTGRTVLQGEGFKMPVLSVSGFTAGMFERVWAKQEADWLRGTGRTLVEAEQEWGVNALVLAAIMVHESGWNGSGLARGKNNLFGLGAGGDDPYANALTFVSRDDCINYTAKMLRDQYLSRGGRFYRGDSLLGVAVNYASDPFWAFKVSRYMTVIMELAVQDNESLLARAGRFNRGRNH